MNMTKLSVSSVILAAVLSGCSQQQLAGGSQVAGGSQSQIEGIAPAIVAPIPVSKPLPVPAPKAIVKRAPVRVYHKPQVRKVAAKPKKTHSVSRVTNQPRTKSGQCFAKVKLAPKYQTKSKRVLIQQASSKRVLVRAPQYRWISKKILVRKAQYTNKSIPALYQNQTKRVLVKPTHHAWRQGPGAVSRIDNASGQTIHRVTVPATYRNVTKRVQVRAVQNVRRFIPAVYKTVKQKQRTSAALYKTVNNPARYSTKNYKVKVASARYTWRPIVCGSKAKHRKSTFDNKALYRSHKTNYKRTSTGDSGISYAQFLAVMNAPMHSTKVKKKSANKKVLKPKQGTVEKVKVARTTDAIPKQDTVEKAKVARTTDAIPKQDTVKNTAKNAETKAAKKAEIQQNIVYGIQAALKSKGYNPGKIDGIMGDNTATALKAFQKSRGLPVGVLSKDTFRALGLVK